MTRRVIVILCLFLIGGKALAQVEMPDLRKMSGVPLPATDLPAGSVSVRVIRGSFANNLAGVSVEFVVDGASRRIKTDASGRAEVSGLPAGARVKAVAEVNGERLETQEITIGQNGVRFVLAASDPETAIREAEDRRLAASPPVKGTVVFGPGSRVVTQYDDERLFIFYVLSILNTARTPVDIGGPLTIELPQGARSVTLVEDSSPQATANGPRVIVTGPFAPGTTHLNVRYELPYSGATATLEQRWPAPLPQVQVFALKTDDLDLRSPQLSDKQSVIQEGLPIIVASGPALAADAVFKLEIIGLPHRAVWPRYVALALAGGLVSLGIWAAIFPATKRSSRTGGRRKQS
jgi:hypothetical protein